MLSFKAEEKVAVITNLFSWIVCYVCVCVDGLIQLKMIEKSWEKNLIMQYNYTYNYYV